MKFCSLMYRRVHNYKQRVKHHLFFNNYLIHWLLITFLCWNNNNKNNNNNILGHCEKIFLNKTKIYWFTLTYLVIIISIVTRSVTDIILLSLHFLIQKHVPLLERPNEADRQTDRRTGRQTDRQTGRHIS